MTYFTFIPFQRQIIHYFAKCIVFADRNISITGIAVHGKYHEDSTVRFICTAELVGQFGPITAIWKLNNATINPTSSSRWKTEVRPEDVYTRRRYQLTVNPLYSGDSGMICCNIFDIYVRENQKGSIKKGQSSAMSYNIKFMGMRLRDWEK